MRVEFRDPLVDALLACQAIKDREIRNRIIWDLEEDQYIFRRHVQDYSDVVELVESCWKYQGGLQRLCERLNRYERNSYQMKAVLLIVEDITIEGILPQDYIEGLYAIANASLLEQVLTTAYHKSLESSGFDLIGNRMSLWNMLKHLTDIPLSKNLHPLLIFVEELISYSNVHYPEIGINLTTWLEKTLLFLELPNSIRTRIQKRGKIFPKAKQNNIPHLLVSIFPKGNPGSEGGTYRFQSVFWLGPDDTEYIYKEDADSNLEQIKQMIDDSLTAVSYKIPNRMAEVIVEFFLPINLLSVGVDQWPIDHEFLGPVKLGTRYMVVVRSLERAKSPRLRGKWPKQWVKFDESCEVLGKKCLKITGRRPRQARELFQELDVSSDVTCLGLCFSPADTELKILEEIISAGVPIALWPRSKYSGESSNEITGLLTKMMGPDQLKDLRQIVHQKRKTAGNLDDSAIGNNLSLLWDDPTRIPRDWEYSTRKRLRPPL